jgi:hypothetical protein
LVERVLAESGEEQLQFELHCVLLYGLDVIRGFGLFKIFGIVIKGGVFSEVGRCQIGLAAIITHLIIIGE